MIEQKMRTLFDREYYLSRYPDVAQAVQEGKLRDPLEHFMRRGQTEHRVPYQFDEAFYGRHYPQAERDIAQGLAADLRTHFETIGWFRGYLPHARAERPADPGGCGSAFGGFWVDRGDALDRIAGRLETGQINDEEAEQLSHWTRKGYLVVPGAIPADELDAALEDLDKAYAGGFDELSFLAEQVRAKPGPFDPKMRDVPAKALDIHWFSQAVRNLVFSERVVRFINLVFESKPLASQTLGFYRGSGQGGHQDSAYVTYSQQRAFLASWIALEDVEAGAGELFYFEGSHVLPDFRYRGRYKSHGEAVRAGLPREEAAKEIAAHMRQLDETTRRFGCMERRLLARRGDVLFWHADLVHGGTPISTGRTRRSIVTHYCPWRIAPLYFERHMAKLRMHQDKGYYSTTYYR